MTDCMVMTRCPSTGQEIATGIACDWATFNNLSAELQPLRCPSCGGEHRWTIEDAWLAPVASVAGADEHRKSQAG